MKTHRTIVCKLCAKPFRVLRRRGRYPTVCQACVQANEKQRAMKPARCEDCGDRFLKPPRSKSTRCGGCKKARRKNEVSRASARRCRRDPVAGVAACSVCAQEFHWQRRTHEQTMCPDCEAFWRSPEGKRHAAEFV